MKTVATNAALLLTVQGAIAVGTVSFDLQKQHHSRTRVLAERADGNAVDSVITNFNGQSGAAYYLNITVGTPGQPQTVQLDTGSSDLYFSAANASFCQSDPGCAGGTFDPSKSSTFEVITPGGFNTQFGDGSTDAGDYVADTVQIGDLVISGVEFGIAYDIYSSVGANTGLMGVGYSTNEGISEGGSFYPNIIDSLVAAKAIGSRFYSLYLNSLSSYGSIIFGGVDTAKYSGDLVTLDSFPNPQTGNLDNFILAVNNIKFNSGGNSKPIFSASDLQDYIPVLPDSGSTAFALPGQVYDAFNQAVQTDQQMLAPCDSVSSSDSFDITIVGNGNNKIVLNVPVKLMFIPAISTSGGQLTDDNGADLCQFAIQQGDDLLQEAGLVVMGDAVMRAGYFAFDLDNAQISVAQAKLDASDSKVVTVKAGTQGLANAIDQPSSDQAAQQTGSIAAPVSGSASIGLSTATNTVGVTSGAEGSGAAATGGSGGSGGSSPSGTGSGSSPSGSGNGSSARAIPSLMFNAAVMSVFVAFGMFAGGFAIML